jgi:hypothetical protein
MHKLAKYCGNALLWLMALVGAMAPAGPGELDIRFGTRGWMALPQLDRLAAAVPQPDGSVVIVGGKWPTYTVNPQPEALVIRLSASGVAQWTRSLGTGFTSTARRLQSGRILIGLFTAYANSRGYIVALNEDGTIDTRFGNQGRLELSRSAIVTGAGSTPSMVVVQGIRELASGNLLVSAGVMDATIPTAWDPATSGVLFSVSSDGRLLGPAAPAQALLRERTLAGTDLPPEGSGALVAARGCCKDLRGLVLVRDSSGALTEAPLTLDTAWSASALTYDDAKQRSYVRALWNSEPSLVALDSNGVPDPSFGSDPQKRVRLAPSTGDTTLLVDEAGSVVTVSIPLPPATEDLARVVTSRAGLLIGRWSAFGSPDPRIDGARLVAVEGPMPWSTLQSVSVARADPGYLWVASSLQSEAGDEGRLARLQIGAGEGPGTLGFQLGALRIAEQGPAQSVHVTRSGGSSGAVSVRYEVVTSTAPGLIPVTGILNWPDGDASPRSFQISAQDDTLLEGEQSAAVRLLDVGGGASLMPEPLTVTIEDDEALLQLRASATTAQIKAGENAQFVVTLDRPAPGPVSATAIVGDAVDGSGSPRYTRRNSSGWLWRSVTWGAGESGDRIVTMPTSTNTDASYAADLYLRLLSQSGLLVRAGSGAEPVGAQVRVVGVAPSGGSGIQAPVSPASPASPQPSASESGGGGATDLWSIALLASLVAMRASRCNFRQPRAYSLHRSNFPILYMTAGHPLAMTPVLYTGFAADSVQPGAAQVAHAGHLSLLQPRRSGHRTPVR